jgi:hypothetical protein
VVQDTYGAGQRPLADAEAAQDWGSWSPGEVLWAAGAPRIRVWLPWFFAAGHRVEASEYRAVGDTVTWRFRAFSDAYERLAGVEPAEGTARLVVEAGRVASFTFATEPQTVSRRERQLEVATAARAAALPVAARRPDRLGTPGLAPRADAAPAPDAQMPGLPLALAGAGATAALLVIRRHGGARPGSGGSVPPPDRVAWRRGATDKAEHREG